MLPEHTNKTDKFACCDNHLGRCEGGRRRPMKALLMPIQINELQNDSKHVARLQSDLGADPS